MHIIELTELQFKNYSNIHSKKNYKQSVEYAKLKELDGCKHLYLGLVDDDNNVHAATLILEKPIKLFPTTLFLLFPVLTYLSKTISIKT